MIHELPGSAFHRCEHLISSAWANVELRSILSGTTPGQVFTDSLAEPRVALVWSPGLKGFFLTGNPAAEQSLGELAGSCKAIAARVCSPESDRLEFSGDSPAWDSVIPRIWSDYGLVQDKQYVYRLRSHLPPNASSAGAGARIPPAEFRFVDAELLSEGFPGAESLHNAVNAFWGSPERFLAAGLGVCALTDGAVVGHCIASHAHGTDRVVDILTDAAYRRRGIATGMAAAFVERCLAGGLEPWWDCMESNVPSQMVAVAVGFRLDHAYTLYSLHL